MEKDRITIEYFRNLDESTRSSSDTVKKISTDDLKQLIEEYILSDQETEAIISELEERIPGYKPPAEIMDLSSDPQIVNYRALGIISNAFNVVGVLVLIIGIIAFMFILNEGDHSLNVGLSITLLIGTILSALSSFAISELIKVFASMSINCADILHHLKNPK